MARGTAVLALTVLVVVTSTAVAAPAQNDGDAATPVGRNGALLIQDVETNLRLFVLGPGSKRPRLVRGIRPTRVIGGAWSPDGLRFAVGDRKLLVVDTRTGRLTTAASRGTDPAWSPDGARLAYSTGGWIWIKTGRSTAKRFVRGGDPTWSPDGSAIAHTATGGIFVTTLGGETKQLLRNGAYECAAFDGSVWFGQPDWSPSGSSIAFARGIGCGTTSYSDIGLVSPEVPTTGEELHSGADDGPADPVWSPDGKAIAFAETYENNPGRIAVYRSPGKIATRLGGNWSLLDWQPLCTFRGTDRSDRLVGRPSADLVCGLGGPDRIAGGAGEDRLFGEAGDDRFFARDGEFDVIGCGPGRDSVDADPIDLVGADCERIVR